MKVWKIKDKNISLETVEALPSIQDYELLCKTKFCSISSEIDLRVIRNEFSKFIRDDSSPGYEVCGEIVQIGHRVSGFKRGDTVISFLPIDGKCGGCGEYFITRVDHTLVVPDNSNLKAITCSILSGVRGYNIFLYKVKISVGDTVLVMNGAHASQLLTLQLAVQSGGYVTTSCSNEKEIGIVRSLGGSITIYDTRSETLDDLVKKTSGLGFDLIIDDGNLSIEKVWKYIAMKGKFCTPYPQEITPLFAQSLFFSEITIIPIFEQLWVLAPTQMGRFLHILRKIVDDMNKKVFVPPHHTCIEMEKLSDCLKDVETYPFQKLLIEYQ